MDIEDKNLNELPVFDDNTDDKNSVYGKPTKAVPMPEKNIGIDLNNTLFDNIVAAGEASQIDISQFESFLNVSQRRDEIYQMIDTMSTDSIVSAILETYAEDATEYNDQGKIVWVESSDSKIASYISFLIDTLNVDKYMHKWAHSLCKYGDVYLRLYRESDYKDPIFGTNETDNQNKKSNLNESISNDGNEKLEEDVKIVAYKDSDKFAHYIEMVPNPAEVFELTKFGKTYGYIRAKSTQTSQKVNEFQNAYYQYQFRRNDVEVFSPTEFVHACLDDSSSRTVEEVKLFLDDSSDENNAYTYQVRRGQSILYNAFKIWRELMLLENSIMLNRITKSSIVRVIGVEVGSMAKESVGPHLQGIKNLIEQKAAIKEGNYMNEYTNPGPVENNIYVPTRNGIGAITTQQIGGDVDVKSLADLDYFKNKFYGSMRIPRQFFSETDDSTGFNGGTSLSIISSRYAKMIKRIQNALVQALTDAVNIMLLDKGLANYINKFQIHMLPPTTQEEIDRRDSLSSKMSIVTDVMNNLNDVEDATLRLKILKSLLSSAISDTEVINLLQEQIDAMESGEAETPTESGGGSIDSTVTLPSRGRELDTEINVGEEVPLEEPNEEGESDNLPTPNDLGIDMTDNQTFSVD